MNYSASNKVNLKEAIDIAVQDLYSPDPYVVIGGLNFFLKKSFDSSEFFPFYLNNNPEVWVALTSLLDIINPTGNIFFKSFSKNELEITDYYPDFLIDEWKYNLPNFGTIEFKETFKYLENNVFLEAVINIIRNASFDSANHYLIANSTVMMKHLVSLILASIEENFLFEVSAAALDILSNVASKIDFSGKRRMKYNNFLEDTIYSMQENPSVSYRFHSHYSQETTPLYLEIVSYIMPIALSIFRESHISNRKLVLSCLEIVQKCASLKENLNYFNRSPTLFTDVITELMCVNNIIYDENFNFKKFGAVVNKVSQKSHLNNIYENKSIDKIPSFYCEGFDPEIRDMSLDVILSLCQLSIAMQLRFVAIPNFVEILVNISSANVLNSAKNGISPLKTEGNQKATQILSILFLLPEANRVYKHLKSSLVSKICADEAISDVICNKAMMMDNLILKQNDDNLNIINEAS